MIIDADNLVLGRASSFIAKNALLGETIEVINCEKAVIIGTRSEIFARYKQKYDRGIPSKGPFLFRNPEKFFKRTIRGMLPHKKETGRKALDRVKCYAGVPENLKGKEATKLKKAMLPKANLGYVTVKDVCKFLGAKI